MTQRALIDHPEQYGATFKETKTIAGQQALCYDVTGTAPSTLSAGTLTSDLMALIDRGLARARRPRSSGIAARA